MSAINDLCSYGRSDSRYNLFYSNDLAIPQDVEVRLSSCIRTFLGLTPKVLTTLRKSVDEQIGNALVVYAARMATLAVRTRDYDFIVNGLTALVIDKDLVDPRDTVCALCLLCDASQRISAFDAERIKHVLKHGVSVRSRLTCQFVDGQVATTLPNHMGFLPTGSGASFLYRSTADED